MAIEEQSNVSKILPIAHLGVKSIQLEKQTYNNNYL